MSTNYDDNYVYDEDYESEELELAQPLLQPQFTTEAQEFKIEPGHTLRLPCQVDKLGEDKIFLFFRFLSHASFYSSFTAEIKLGEKRGREIIFLFSALSRELG